jgi:hypothetical protein
MYYQIRVYTLRMHIAVNLHLNTKLCMRKLKGQVIWHVTNAIHQIQLIKIYSYFGAEISQ